MNGGIPIVFIHKGYSWYLNYTFRQSLVYNKDSRHFILGDKHINRFKKAEFVDIDRYRDSTNEFLKRYKHLSSNDPAIELFCFERWFYLRDLMKEYKLEKVFTCDSDVMLFYNISEEGMDGDAFCIPYNQENFELTASAHVSYWTYKGICDFCAFITSIYSKEKFPEELEEKWNSIVKRNIPGGISDMAILYLFAKGKIVSNLIKVKNNTVYDHNINCGANFLENEYATENKMKKYIWKNNSPIGYNLLSNQEVRFKSIHFQGASKNQIPEFFKFNQGLRKAAWLKFVIKGNRIIRKIKGQPYK